MKRIREILRVWEMHIFVIESSFLTVRFWVSPP